MQTAHIIFGYNFNIIWNRFFIYFINPMETKDIPQSFICLCKEASYYGNKMIFHSPSSVSVKMQVETR